MKIAINALSAQTGAGLSCSINLLPALDNVDKKNKYIAILSKYQKEIIRVVPTDFEKIIVPFHSGNIFIRLFFEQFCLPILLLLRKVNILYSVGNVTSILAPCKIVLLVENANPFTYQKYKRPISVAVKLLIVKIFGLLSIRRADKIRFVSENSRQIICTQLKIPEDKLVVIHHGINVQISEQENTRRGGFTHPQMPERYILTVADIYPHKNIRTLIDAYGILIDKYQYDGNLLIVGNVNDKIYYRYLLEKKIKLNKGNKIIFTGKVEYKKIGAFYEKAELFIFTSVEETFGIPLIEAMLFGVPIVASDCSSLPGIYFNPCREICGEAAEYFSSFNIDSLADKMYKIISNNELRIKLINTGFQQVKKYDWSNIAQSLSEVFNSIPL